MMSPDPSRPTIRSTNDLADPISTILANRRRHHVLTVLASGADRTSSFDDLSVAVTALERAGQTDSPSDSSSEVAISLHHCHLPKLADVGVIGYDRDGEAVSLTERGAESARALRAGRFDR